RGKGRRRDGGALAAQRRFQEPVHRVDGVRGGAGVGVFAVLAVPAVAAVGVVEGDDAGVALRVVLAHGRVAAGDIGHGRASDVAHGLFLGVRDIGVFAADDEHEGFLYLHGGGAGEDLVQLGRGGEGD